jgi:hypothetical protein
MGGLLLLQRSASAGALVDIGHTDGEESWRYTSPGRLFPEWTVNYESDIGIVEMLSSPPSTALLVLDGNTGSVRFRVPFPTSSTRISNFKCVQGNEVLNMRSSPAGSVFASSDGNMYVQVEVLNESTSASCGSASGSHLYENTLSLLKITPEGEANWRVFAQIHSDGNSAFHPQQRLFAGESIPDGLDGVLAAWTHFYAGVKGGEKPHTEACLTRLSPSEQHDFVLPMPSWIPAVTGLFYENMVLGENDTLYATDKRSLVSFHIPSGEVKWVRRPPNGGVDIQHATSGGGILVTNIGRATYFNPQGEGAILP